MIASPGQVADNKRMTEIDHHPLILTLQDAISGNGFLAGITLTGRALMQKEDDGKWWMYGIRPGGIAEGGNTPQETFMRFRNRYKEVLFDIAQEKPTFHDFKKEVERFFREADEQDERRWDDALRAIRSGKLTPPEPFSELPRETPEQKPSEIIVEQLSAQGKRFTPRDNIPDKFSKAA